MWIGRLLESVFHFDGNFVRNSIPFESAHICMLLLLFHFFSKIVFQGIILIEVDYYMMHVYAN